MLDQITLAAALCAALPANQQPHADAFATAILAALADQTTAAALANPLFIPLFHTLIDRSQMLAAGDTLLSFGRNNDQRGATITVSGDVAGGHIIKDATIRLSIPITLISGEQVHGNRFEGDKISGNKYVYTTIQQIVQPTPYPYRGAIKRMVDEYRAVFGGRVVRPKN